METFSEVTTILVLYCMMCFTDYVEDPLIRNNYCGKVFIGIVSFYAFVHIVFLMLNLCSQIKTAIRSWYYARRNRKLREKAARRNAYKVE